MKIMRENIHEKTFAYEFEGWCCPFSVGTNRQHFSPLADEQNDLPMESKTEKDNMNVKF